MSGSSGSNVLREFLVGLGFNVDEAGFRKTIDYIERVTKNAGLMAIGLKATAAAIGEAVIKISTQFESLFYLAQRAGTTAESLQQLQMAFGQVGLSAQDAAGAIQALGQGMRTNPGLKALVESLGVSTLDKTTGKLRDTKDIWVDLMAALTAKGDVVGSRLAGMFGMSETMYYQLKANMPQLLAALKQAGDAQKNAGVDSNAFAEKSREVMNQLRTDTNEVFLIWERVAGELQGPMLTALQTFATYAHDHSKEITDVGVGFAKSFSGVLDDVNLILVQIDKLVKATIGWGDAIKLIGDVILLRWLGPLALVFMAIDDFRKRMTGETVTPGFDPDVRKKDESDWNNSPWNPNHWFGMSHPLLQNESYGGGANFNPADVNKTSYSSRSGGGGANPDLTPEIEAEVRKQARAQGVDPDKAVALFRAEGGGYRNVSSAGAIGPGQLMPGTAKDLGVNPWDWRDNVRGGVKYLAQMLRKFGGNYDAASAAYNAGPGGAGVDVLAKTGNRAFLPNETKAYLDHIETNLRAGSGNRGSGGGQVTQTNTFNITGGDAHQIADKVAAKQRTVNADLVRYGTGAILA